MGDSVSMSASTQPAAALTAEFGVKKAGLGALKEHQGNAGRGRGWRGGQIMGVPEASAEVEVEWATDVSARAPGGAVWTY